MSIICVTRRAFEGIWDSSIVASDGEGKPKVISRNYEFNGEQRVTYSLDILRGGYCPMTKAEFYRAFLDCNDKSKSRKECGQRLTRIFCDSLGSDATAVRQVWLYTDGSTGGTPQWKWKWGCDTSYLALVKACAKHYCVPESEIQRLPIVGPEDRERWHRYEQQQRNEFYSRHRNCEA